MLPKFFADLRKDVKKVLGVNDTVWDGNDLVVFVGRNASGKSLVRRYIKIVSKELKIHVMDFSQERRASGGIETAFIYGAESWESTGYITAHTFIQAFKQPFDRDTLLIWDEPEIGLSEEAQLGVAQFIKEKLREKQNPKLLGVVLMTHSRVILRELMDYPRLGFLDIDGTYPTPAAWCNREVVPENLEELHKRGVERFRQITKLLKEGEKRGKKKQ